eukprot:4693975-Pleurochrysis_carterae.AAC.2
MRQRCHDASNEVRWRRTPCRRKPTPGRATGTWKQSALPREVRTSIGESIPAPTRKVMSRSRTQIQDEPEAGGERLSADEVSTWSRKVGEASRPQHK